MSGSVSIFKKNAVQLWWFSFSFLQKGAGDSFHTKLMFSPYLS